MDKICPNCVTKHDGMFNDCYACFDCETDYEYEERRRLSMTHSKLDVYDYVVLPGVIRIGINGVSDPILVDILSEIEQVNGRIYVEGFNYQYMDEYDIVIDHPEYGSYMDLKVASVA